MNDRSLEVLEQYEIDVMGTKKGRGAVLVETGQGYMVLKEYNGSAGRIDYEEELLLKINDMNMISVDTPIRNKENMLISKLDDGSSYILKKWYVGRECDVKQMCDIYEGAKNLGILHQCMNKVAITAQVPKESENIYEEYYKYNRELKRVRNYIRNKNKRNQFELDILKHFDTFYGLAQAAAFELEKICANSVYEQSLKLTHGNYNYHNIIFTGNKVAVINFESSKRQLQIVDVYNYLRKVMEKYQWNEQIGIKLLECYNDMNNISDKDRRILRILLSYPEKFRKVVNHYYNSNKAFIPDKSIEKLQQVISFQEHKSSFMLKI